MFNHKKVKLISEAFTQDSIGQNIAATNEAAVFCEIFPITQNEFYKAGNSGYKPEMKVKVWSNEYHGERFIMIDGEKYSIYRTYESSDGKTELYLERRIGNG